MADTRTQVAVEDWVRRHWMPQQYGQRFSRDRLSLSSGGVFDFDAVSTDGSIAASISTSRAKTSSGKHAVGKLFKLRSDMLFLILTDVQRRIIVLTERDMFELCQKEVSGGRVPAGIEFALAEIPADLGARLKAARATASREVGPRE